MGIGPLAKRAEGCDAWQVLCARYFYLRISPNERNINIEEMRGNEGGFVFGLYLFVPFALQ